MRYEVRVEHRMIHHVSVESDSAVEAQKSALEVATKADRDPEEIHTVVDVLKGVR